MKRKDILGLYDMDAAEIDGILARGLAFKAELKAGRKVFHALAGRSMVTLFFENSTRTRCSFEFAGKFLGGQVVNISAAASSVQKGETLVDTGKTLDAMKTDVIVIRHPAGGAPHLLAKTVKAHVINAGDGMNEHPSQALLDMLTMRENFGSVSGLKVAILGDISHSRVAKSNLYGLTKLGAQVSVYGPRTLMPAGLDAMGAKVCSSREEAVEGADVVMGLRIQLERQKAGNFPSLGEYAKYYGADGEVMKYAKPGALIMHPGPVNRGVELTSGLIDGPSSRIEEQVLSGVAVRMAMLSLLVKEDQDAYPRS